MILHVLDETTASSEALDLADRGYVLETGSLAVQGPAEALLADDALRRAYLGG